MIECVYRATLPQHGVLPDSLRRRWAERHQHHAQACGAVMFRVSMKGHFALFEGFNELCSAEDMPEPAWGKEQ